MVLWTTSISISSPWSTQMVCRTRCELDVNAYTWSGFVYTQTNDRLWRKNRQAPPSGSSCYGTDINRNWDYQWSTPGGSSTDPCAEDYRGKVSSISSLVLYETSNFHALLGTSPASAPENVVHTNFINKLASAQTGLKLYIDYHSYSQLFMTRKTSPPFPPFVLLPPPPTSN